MPPESNASPAPARRPDVLPEGGALALLRERAGVVESLGAQPAAIVVERAMYASQGSQFWAAGTNALAARVR